MSSHHVITGYIRLYYIIITYLVTSKSLPIKMFISCPQIPSERLDLQRCLSPSPSVQSVCISWGSLRLHGSTAPRQLGESKYARRSEGVVRQNGEWADGEKKIGRSSFQSNTNLWSVLMCIPWDKGITHGNNDGNNDGNKQLKNCPAQELSIRTLNY